MRLAESRIKEAILHPDAEIRDRAVQYFVSSFSQDTSIVNLVIEAVEQYGRDGAYHLIGGSADLAHTHDSISWVLDELSREDADKFENYSFNLTRVLCHADPALLVHREKQVIEARHFFASYRDVFLERLEMLSWDEAACWRELEAICEAGKNNRDTREVDLPRAGHILEALARIGGRACEARVLAVLGEKVVSLDNNPMQWMEPLMVELAGFLRLHAAMPIIVEKLHEDDDVLASNCEKALIRIGNDEAVAAIADRFAAAKRHFKLYVAAVIEGIHSDSAAEKCISLLAQEPDRFIQRRLAEAALSQFTYGAIEPVRQMISSQYLDGELRNLRDYLVETCEIMAERFPEFDAWKAAGAHEREEHFRQLAEVSGDPQRMLQFALQKLAGYHSRDDDDEEPPHLKLPANRLDAEATSGTGLASALGPAKAVRHVGRNDPCPCGSGKKYKKCCLKKRGNDPLLS